MKKLFPSALALVLVLAGGCASVTTPRETPKNISVTFQESDKFTDARSSFGFDTDENYLAMLADHLKEVAGRVVPAGQQLDVTITDIDLAGEFLPTQRTEQIRIVKEIFIPRMELSFRLTDASGTVLKEGQRRLTDLSFMSNLGIVGRNEPLFYDKALLTDWVRKEFNP